MFVVNFAHPLTPFQRKQIEHMMATSIDVVHDISCQFDNQQPFIPQINALLALVPLTAQEWQTEPILINPPAYAPAASALIAELHGRMGHFPAIIRIRPVNGSTPPQFEVAEIINLQAVRDRARRQR